MLKPIISIQVPQNGTFSEAFPDGIPANSNIDKSKTGNGMTRAALLSKGHYIIINPQTNTIVDKEQWCRQEQINVFKIHSDTDGNQLISDEEISQFLCNQFGYFRQNGQ